MKKKLKGYLFFLALVFWAGLPFLAEAGYAKISWDPNSESDLAGYKIYYGKTARTGNTPAAGYTVGPVDVSNTTTYDTPNLEGGGKYYFSVVAYNTSGNVSEFSSEVNKTILAGDINNDKKVDIFDYRSFVINFGNTSCENRANIKWSDPAVCKVDIFDFASLVKDFGKTSP
jgi:hypothetical protein